MQKLGFIIAVLLMALGCVPGAPAPSDYGDKENIAYNPCYNNTYHCEYHQ